MLRQDINLYLAFAPPPPTSSLLTWPRFWYANLFITLFLTAVCLFSLIETYFFTATLDRLQQQTALLEDKVTTLKKTLPDIFFSSNLTTALKDLEDTVASEKKIMSAIQEYLPFSDILQAFSAVTPENVWLTSINITRNGHEITLKGNSVNKEVLQTFITAIFKHPLFQHFQFTIQNIEDVAKDNPNHQLTFDMTIAKKT